MLGNVTFDINTMLYAAVATLLGLQAVSFALFSKVFAIDAGLLPPDDRLTNTLRSLTLERGLIPGLIFLALGATGGIYSFLAWGMHSFGPMVPSDMLRISIPSLTLLALGMQVVFANFFLSLLRIKHT